MTSDNKIQHKLNSGIIWEGKTSLETFFSSLTGYRVESWPEIHPKAFQVYFADQKVASIFKQHAIYQYLKKVYAVEEKKYVSKLLIPDQALLVHSTNIFFVIECKSQKTSGSVDEKLQTCDFKIKQWRKILCEMNLKTVEYVYLLNKWFRRAEYRDVLDYINSVAGCSFYFQYIPLTKFGLPSSLK